MTTHHPLGLAYFMRPGLLLSCDCQKNPAIIIIVIEGTMTIE